MTDSSGDSVEGKPEKREQAHADVRSESASGGETADRRDTATTTEAATTSSTDATEPADSGPEPAGLGRRIGAHAIDIVVLTPVFWGIAFVIALLVGGTDGAGFSISGGPAVVSFLLFFVSMALYFIVLEAVFGWTIGKRLLGLTVVSEDGRAIDMMASVKRNFLRIVDGGPFFVWFLLYPVGLGLIATSDDGQRLGDRIAGTLVVRRSG